MKQELKKNTDMYYRWIGYILALVVTTFVIWQAYLVIAKYLRLPFVTYWDIFWVFGALKLFLGSMKGGGKG